VYCKQRLSDVNQRGRRRRRRWATNCNISVKLKLNMSKNSVDVNYFTKTVSTLLTWYYWRRGVVVSGVRRMNEVNARRARLVPGWVTAFGRVYHLGM